MDDLEAKLDRFENGHMGQLEELAFFQELVDSGHAWTLQGLYSHTAETYLAQGKIEARNEKAQRMKEHGIRLTAAIISAFNN